MYQSSKVKRCKWAAAFALTLSLFHLFTLPAQAQTIVQTVPQSTRQRAFTAAAAPATFTVRNIGQNVHTAVITASSSVIRFNLRIEASFDGITFFPISDEATSNTVATTQAVSAVGFFPVVRLNLLAIAGGGTVTVDYSGTSSSPQNFYGVFNSSQSLYRIVARGQTNNGELFSQVVNTPSGTSSGLLMIDTTSGDFAACQLAVSPILPNEGGTGNIFSLTGPPNATKSVFPISGSFSPEVSVTLTNCAATARTFDIVYLFTPQIAEKLVTANGQWGSEADFACTQSAAFTLAGASNTQIVALAAGQTIRVCHISFSLTAADAVKIVQGTGAACAGTPADMSGVYPATTALNLNFGPGAAIRTSVGFAVCINVAGAATGGGIVSFARF